MPQTDLSSDEKLFKFLLKSTKCKCKDITLALTAENATSTSTQVQNSTTVDIFSNQPLCVKDAVVFNKSLEVKCIEGQGSAMGLEPQPTDATSQLVSPQIAAGDLLKLIISFEAEELCIKDKNCSFGSAYVTFNNVLVSNAAISGFCVCGTEVVPPSITVLLCLEDLDTCKIGHGQKKVILTYTGIVPFDIITTLTNGGTDPTTGLVPTSFANPVASTVDICFNFSGSKNKCCKKNRDDESQ